MQGVGFRGSNCSEDFAWSSGLLFMRGVLNRGLGFRVGALKKRVSHGLPCGHF